MVRRTQRAVNIGWTVAVFNKFDKRRSFGAADRPHLLHF